MRSKMYALCLLSVALVATILIHVQKPIPNSQAPAAEVPEASRQRVVETYGKLPLYFIENQGQLDPAVKFLSRGSGYNLFLTATDAVLALRDPSRDETSRLAVDRKGAVVRMKLSGANPSPQVTGADELPGK